MSMILLFSFWILFGAATAYFAQQRGRDPLIWFVIGTFLGLLGLLLLFLLPSLEDTDEQLPGETEEHLLLQSKDNPASKTHEYFIKDWFYLDASRQQQGPFRFDELKNLFLEGKLSLDSYVWSEGMENWKIVADLPELQEHLSSS